MTIAKTDIGSMLKELKMPDIREHYQQVSTQAANENGVMMSIFLSY